MRGGDGLSERMELGLNEGVEMNHLVGLDWIWIKRGSWIWTEGMGVYLTEVVFGGWRGWSWLVLAAIHSQWCVVADLGLCCMSSSHPYCASIACVVPSLLIAGSTPPMTLRVP